MTRSNSQVFVSGTWRDDKAVAYAETAAHVGALIAAAGWSLACGPGTGISRYVIDGFRSISSRGGLVRYHLPAASHMTKVGETIQPGADEIIETDLDYPMRNVYQVSRSQGLIAITGGDGTLEEILPALIDYNLPVGVLKGSGPAAAALEVLLDIFPEWRPHVLIDDDPGSIVRFVLETRASTSSTSGDGSREP